MIEQRDDAHPYALLDFVKGEMMWMTPEENAARAVEWAKRTTVKNGIVYVDCDPPEDGE